MRNKYLPFSCRAYDWFTINADGKFVFKIWCGSNCRKKKSSFCY